MNYAGLSAREDTVYLSDRKLEHLRSVVNDCGERYQVLELLGQGGMGAVYAAEDTLLERRVAIKILHTPFRESEVRILARLEHPGIVPVYDSGTLADGRVFFVMKLIEGARLDEYSSQPHAINERLRVFEKICEPVAFAHSHGVIHRDLKPSNIMIGNFGEVLVLDWGVAAVAGTKGFVAPEPEHATVAGDIFALGCILQSLTGISAPRALSAIAAKASAASPEVRYSNVAGLIADITCFLDGQRVSAYSEAPHEWLARQLGRHKVLIGLVAAYLVMRAALIIFTGR